MSVLPADLAAEVQAALIRLRELGIHATLIGMLPEGEALVVCQAERDVVPLCNLILAAYKAPKDRTLN